MNILQSIPLIIQLAYLSTSTTFFYFTQENKFILKDELLLISYQGGQIYHKKLNREVNIYGFVS